MVQNDPQVIEAYIGSPPTEDDAVAERAPEKPGSGPGEGVADA